MFGLTDTELAVFKKLTTPIKIQDFLDTFPINWETDGETYYSPRKVLREQKMHCFEGALVAAVALWLHSEPPLLLDLKAPKDVDHVVTLYKRNGYWGGISKTNHAVLRFRDPVYKTIRELALSYFHEYFDNATGKKMLRSYSKPFSVKKFGTAWVTSEEDLDEIAEALDESPHFPIFPKENLRYVRPADQTERRAGEIIEWQKP